MHKRTISDFLIGQARDAARNEAHVSFHMPGHKGRMLAFDKTGSGDILRNITACDITEIPGADALFSPSSTIKQVMENYAELYGVKHTELLVNGSSAGIMAAVISSVPVGGRLIMGRNSHHSAFSALRLGGINPVYLRPETDKEYGLVGAIRPGELIEACEKYPEASAVLITSPNYYGMLSDIRMLADIAHKHDMLLIVDQAHGAHLRFFDYQAQQGRENGGYVVRTRTAAESLGADIVVNSTHKTLFSFTGTGILNVCTDRVEIAKLADTLRMLQTTSPSYLLMASLDVNEKMMREYGISVINHWKQDLSDFYRLAGKIRGLTVVTGAGMDLTKINISMSELGLSGEKLDKELRRRNIISEMVHGDYVMLMTGAGNTAEDYTALLAALRAISDEYGLGVAASAADTQVSRSFPEFRFEVADVPVDSTDVPLYNSEGCVMYDPITIYPPGTPIVCPGEIMTAEAINYITAAITRGEKVTGVDEEGMIRAAADR